MVGEAAQAGLPLSEVFERVVHQQLLLCFDEPGDARLRFGQRVRAEFLQECL